ncbi:electron transfer flavoprotein subunit alpha [Mycolicibacterium madagascariense]|uniref:Electron transfer flavoprotein subunit alpha n=1 Tax=Mycolicibacterium madagascariense TaxID=212765 RepID=A0A7I7XEZ3_9MYCO|nr:electron transfer flavoprotein subunit alpha/FixB family protein [Mycolicibacterium madagascariense]MCV7015459.1 electron transfer flavoprotein subunit alpha/FixB family protein [Mycolicibacterium madagascariense]BBZ27758.1 electron transfer flavoprotein subunit alpha [Mycolicibacterium madagascariense]
MTEVLVLAEHAEGKLKNVTAELITAARALGEPSAVVIGAPGTAEKLIDGLKAAGAAKIYVAESDVVEQYLVTPKVDVLNALVESVSPVAVITVASAEGKEIAGRVAAETGSGVLIDVIGVKEGPIGIHSIFGGAYTTEAKAEGDAPAIALRPGAVEAEPSDGAGEVVTVEVPAPGENATKITSRQPAQKSARPELTEAKIVVAGGRGVGSKENFGIVEDLADAFGAAVGASRAAVDSGFYEGQFQVGQTGKTVSPQLYLALGISGAIQHRAGMQTSKTIVAVNKDEEAPIFEIADYGIVGDLFKVAPQLTDAVKTRKG